MASPSEFLSELTGKLTEKHGAAKAEEYMKVYTKLNESPFKNLAWMKELEYLSKKMEGMSDVEKRTIYEAILAGLELYKSQRAYGKIYNHYKSEMDKQAPHLVITEPIADEVLTIEKVSKTRKIKKESKEKDEAKAERKSKKKEEEHTAYLKSEQSYLIEIHHNMTKEEKRKILQKVCEIICS